MEDGGVGECEPSIWLLDPPRRASSCAASPPTAVHAGLSAAGLAAGRRVPRWMCAGPRSHAQRRRVWAWSCARGGHCRKAETSTPSYPTRRWMPSISMLSASTTDRLRFYWMALRARTATNPSQLLPWTVQLSVAHSLILAYWISQRLTIGLYQAMRHSYYGCIIVIPTKLYT